jgi:lysophospholipase L1-like esterase
MKRERLMCALAGLVLLGACATQGSGGMTGSGGSGGVSSSGGSSAGGSTGTGGGPSGGNTGSGGATANGGATGSGGATANGGATGSGGATGIGGTGTGGAMGGKGGSGTGGNAANGGTTGTGGAAGGSGTPHWVGTWTASPYYDASNPPAVSLSNSVVRQVTHISLGGNQLRVQFSNLAGNGSVTINSAHIAICGAPASVGSAVDSTINTATDKALAFSGMAAVTIMQGKEVWSDPISFTVAPLGDVTITTAFGSVPGQVTGHTGSRTTSYIQTGSTNVSAASMTSATPIAQWFYISGIDVMADASAKAIVAIGDSLTDGRGTDTDHNNRWTDDLAVRLQGMTATSDVAMMNQGIGATNLVGTGTAAQARFSRDVLGQDGVRYVIVFDGVNDIGNGATFASMQTVYASLISQAHAHNLLIYGATIMPFGTNTYYTVAHEAVRQQVNTYIKSGVFDAYFDFDAAVTDGGNPPALQTQYDTWAQTDGLHLNPAGYQKLADSIDLTLFTK